MNKRLINQIQITLAIVAVICAGMALLTVLSAMNTPRHMVTNTFYVATYAGEAFEVIASHRCGLENMRLAAIRATQNQTERVRPKTLEALTRDHARLNDNFKPTSKYRCEIEFLEFTNITGKAYIVEK